MDARRACQYRHSNDTLRVASLILGIACYSLIMPFIILEYKWAGTRKVRSGSLVHTPRVYVLDIVIGHINFRCSCEVRVREMSRTEK